MKLPSGFALGVCTHTGRVRVSNEDDYLVAALPAPGPFLVAIADGMGGLVGGAEASRTALRGLGAAVLDGASAASVTERLRAGFAAASARVHEAASAIPALRDMGTTLTAICFLDGVVGTGHIGDTRLFRLRGSGCSQLTTDHATREPDNLLTRCIGAGHATSVADHAEFPARPGDRFLLVSDGVWSVLSTAVLQRTLAAGTPQQAAEALVAQALAAGGPDNATAVVVEVLTASPAGGGGEVELPREERDDRLAFAAPVSLRPPIWPWLLLAVAALLLAHAVAVWAGLEPLAGLRGWWAELRQG